MSTDDFNIPGAENTNFMAFGDPSGDAQAEENRDRMGVGWTVLIIFACGIVATGLVFLGMMLIEKHKQRVREAQKLGEGSSQFSSPPRPSGATVSSGQSGLESSSPTSPDPEKRRAEIEKGVIVQTWMEDVHPSSEEQKSDEEASGADDHKNSCPICQKAFEAGVEVCSSRNQTCGHTFHKTCIFNWLQYQNRCPACNEEYLSSTGPSLS